MHTVRQQDSTPLDQGVGESRLGQVHAQLESARMVLAGLLTDIENITHHINPSIEAEWQVKIGTWETKLLEARIAMLRAKRKAELVQACINKGAAADEAAIERELDAEFDTWQDQLDAATRVYNQALATRKASVKIDQQSAQLLKDVFRTLAKRLHPDINKASMENAHMMFFLAQSAYKQADLDMLQSLEVSTRGLEADKLAACTLDAAETELASVLEQVAVLEKCKQGLMAEKPYCLLELIRDNAWVDEQVDAIRAEIATCQQAEATYCARIEEQLYCHG